MDWSFYRDKKHIVHYLEEISSNNPTEEERQLIKDLLILIVDYKYYKRQEEANKTIN